LLGLEAEDGSRDRDDDEHDFDDAVLDGEHGPDHGPEHGDGFEKVEHDFHLLSLVAAIGVAERPRPTRRRAEYEEGGL
jgi:hypothetical protein